jgi:hypothetical protein
VPKPRSRPHTGHTPPLSPPATPTCGPTMVGGPFKCSIHPEWLRRLETLCASAQSDIAQDCIVKAFQLMPRTQLLPPIGKDLVQPTPMMRALNVMSADVHGCLQFPNNPIGSLLDPREVGCDHQHNFDVSSCVRPARTTRSGGRGRRHTRRVYQPAGYRKTSRRDGRSSHVLHGQALAIASFARSPKPSVIRLGKDSMYVTMTRTCSRLLMVCGGQNTLLSEPNSSRTSIAPTQRPLRKLDLPARKSLQPSR